MVNRRKRLSITGDTVRCIGNIIPEVLSSIEKKFKSNPVNIIESWPTIIGRELAAMTKVVSLEDGVLTVKVKSSTLYSLLNNYEKDKILKKMQSNFSEKVIRKLCFKIG